MKHVIRIATHMIVGGASMLIFAEAFDSAWEITGYCLVTMLLVGILYGLRHKAESFWLFLGSHFILLLGGSLMILIIDAYGWYIAIWVFWVLYSAILRLMPAAERLDEPGVPYVLWLILVYLCICVLDGSIAVQRVSLSATGIVFLLCLLYGNLESMDEFILTGSFSTKVDEHGIKKMNNRLSLLYTGVLGAVLGIFSLLRVDGLWQTVLGWIRKFLRFLVSLLPISEQAKPEEEIEVENDMMNLFQEMEEEQEFSQWMQQLNEIFRCLITVLLVAVVLAGIVYAAISIYRHFNKTKDREEGDKVIETLSFGEGIAKERKNRFFERFERNPARRIRKIYKKNMKRLATKYMLDFRYMPPEEQVQLLQKQGLAEENIGEIRSLYEKARYSADLVTEVEADRMRTIM